MSFLQSKLKWIAAAMSLIYAALVLALSLAWYKDQMIEPFHFFNDLPEWKQLDKFAHFFWTFQVSAVVFRLLSWGGWQSAKWASLIGFGLVSSVEIPDGFSAGYGASIFDLVANAFGAGCFFAQMHFFKSIRFFAKFSFHATPYAIQRPSLLGDGFLQELLKDYNGQTFWYAWAPAIKFWPRWLSLAVGLGAEGMIYGRDAENLSHGFVPFRKIVFSVDLNFASLKFEQPWLQAITYPFHIIKFPAPALEVSERGWKFHWLYF